MAPSLNTPGWVGGNTQERRPPPTTPRTLFFDGRRPSGALLDRLQNDQRFRGVPIQPLLSATCNIEKNDRSSYLSPENDQTHDAIAADLFPRLRFDRLLLEYDTPRAGDFIALRHVSEETCVVLGLVTTKSGQLEEADAVERRVREASQIVPLPRLAVSPQCGFASVEVGNPLSPEQQEAKIRLVVEVARRIWGG